MGDFRVLLFREVDAWDMGADCTMTIRVWEIDRVATVEDS